MSRMFQPLLFMLAVAAEDELRKQIELFKAENEMLRRRVPKKRIHLEPEERDKLLELGLALLAQSFGMLLRSLAIPPFVDGFGRSRGRLRKSGRAGLG